MRRLTHARSARHIHSPMLSATSFLLAAAVGLISALIFSNAYDMARVSLFNQERRVEGVWSARWRDIPAVTVRLKQEGEIISGTVQFKKILSSPFCPVAIDSTGELPLMHPRLDGERLFFEVHDDSDCSPANLLEMEMRFTGKDDAELYRHSLLPYNRDGDVGLCMKREDSF